MANRLSVLPQRNDRAGRWRRWLLLALVIVLGWWSTGLLGALSATAARPRATPDWRELAGRPIEVVSVQASYVQASDLPASDDVTVHGWLVEPAQSTGRAVVLAAGIGGNRVSMVERARFYVDEGIAALLVDLRGTGSSGGERISMGWHEALDLLAWRRLLRARGYARVGVHGQSLGAAAAAYTEVRGDGSAGWEFLVLEACYRDIRSALAARTRGLPEFLSWPLLFWSEWLLDVDVDDLDPVVALRSSATPLLVVCGDGDQLVGPDAAQMLFAATRASVRRLHLVPGVGHRDLWSRSSQALPAALRSFLAEL